MTACNNSHSSSRHQPVCCVYTGTENQPLLGYHPHQYQQQQQQHRHQGEYHLNISDEKNYASLEAEYPQSTSQCERASRRKKFRRHLLLLLVLGFVYFTFFHSCRNNYFHQHQDPDTFGRGSNTDNNSDRSNIAYPDSCLKHADTWEKPWVFDIDAANFQLKFGQGSMGSRVQVYTGAVQKPTFELYAKASLSEDEDGDEGDKRHRNSGNDDNSNRGDAIEVVRHGVHLEFKQSLELSEALIWFEDHYVEHGGYKYRACAQVDINIIVPESYKRYGSISVEGAVTSINAHDLDNIKFDKLNLVTATGNVITKDNIHADQFSTHVSAGNAEIESVQTASDDGREPLDVKVVVNTGHVVVGVETNPVGKNESRPHRILVQASTGSVKLDVAPAKAKSSGSMAQKPGHLQIDTSTNTGTVRNLIQLASEDQTLNLSSSSRTGTVDATVSDSFLGRFDLSTMVGNSKVVPALGSESSISYEKQTPHSKIGFKTLSDNKAYESEIKLRTITGRTFLEFIK
ncbi:hypothetical protein BX616_009830 [Lobosporangium transversale]|uniref:DUF7330 domain-containing protein n=1 Tax=Lobosporangium transversale TaxID=64571 RepID=A0A1Y2H4Z7_9FUNG|nr:hypothetical protein BCR41DRAFT_382942 [Lobosporangium transversale]KAF9918234.1 hypothetical protein BX616_009830 [Lobosporangium transversale]ORZ29084.1 hypothetical protein BCR41DRAFT_382942 [Lobosporangium transversale]|eukprot:XP_021886757.1 hypothetical protein BCR41DRAFT_382942 [Lobosporangium transversale]